MTAPVLDQAELILKPCPHCGAPAVLGCPDPDEGCVLPEDEDSYWVTCTGCPAFLGGVPGESAKDVVIAQWNRRDGGAE